MAFNAKLDAYVNRFLCFLLGLTFSESLSLYRFSKVVKQVTKEESELLKVDFKPFKVNFAKSCLLVRKTNPFAFYFGPIFFVVLVVTILINAVK